MMHVGCDIVEIKRIAKACEKEDFLRVLSDDERSLYEAFHGPRQIEWLAGRFAAKEAIYKAIHSFHPCVISQISVISDEAGAPVCMMDGCLIQVSIAHEKEYAIAYAIAQEVCL